MNSCSDYEGMLPDYQFTISSKKTYTIPGDNLLLNIPIDGYKCMIAFYNSTDDKYHLGDAFLQDYYAVYDLENFRLGLGKAKVFESVVVKPDHGKNDKSRQHLMANLLIAFGVLAVIALIALWTCRKKGERQPVRHRFPLVDETANSFGSTVEPDARPESLLFIERSEEERKEDGEDGEDGEEDDVLS